MNALILAAGFGTRLKPWTDHSPKALVPVEGVPMLERVIRNLEKAGADKICVNVHHFGERIIEFLEKKDFEAEIIVSDERDGLLDTGGGVVKAYRLFNDGKPMLVHNVDILGNADLQGLYRTHLEGHTGISLLVSDRSSRRKLIFDGEMVLRGWHDLENDIYKGDVEKILPEGFKEYAFSGLYVVGEKAVSDMEKRMEGKKFPLMDYLMNPERETEAKGYMQEGLILIDIGKPATLSQASEIFKNCQPF